MNPAILVAISSFFLLQSVVFLGGVEAAEKATKPEAKGNSQIIVMGLVYCDICSNNTFSKHSYFLPGDAKS